MKKLKVTDRTQMYSGYNLLPGPPKLSFGMTGPQKHTDPTPETPHLEDHQFDTHLQAI